MNWNIYINLFWISAALSYPTTWQDCYSSCYRFVETEQPWHLALQYCIVNDMKLAQIEDAGEFQFIRNTLKRHYGVNAQEILEFWIDGYYNATQRQWIWFFRNERVSFFSWGPGEPNGIDQCIGLLNHEDFYMNVDKCEIAKAYICEDEFRYAVNRAESSSLSCVKTNYKDTDLPAHYVTEDQETDSTRMNPLSDEKCFGCVTITLS